MKIISIIVCLFLFGQYAHTKSNRKPNSQALTTNLTDGVLTINDSENINKKQPRLLEILCPENKTVQNIKKTVDNYNSLGTAHIKSARRGEDAFVIQLGIEGKVKSHFFINIPSHAKCIISEMRLL